MGTWQPVRRSGRAIYPFEADGESQVSLEEGDEVYAEFEFGGWYRGFVQAPDKTISGIFPVSYIVLDEGIHDDEIRDRASSLEVLTEPPHIEAVIVKENRRKCFQLRATGNPGDECWDCNNCESASKSSADRCEAEGTASEMTKQTEEERNRFTQALPKEVASGCCPATNDTSQNSSEMSLLVEEVSMAIPRFEAELKSVLSEGSIRGYHDLKQKIAQLLSMRRLLLDPGVDDGLREKTRIDIIGILESCRRSNEGHICPRTPCHSVANVSNTPIRQLIKLHQEMYSIVQKESSSLWRQTTVSRQSQMLADPSEPGATTSVTVTKDIDFDQVLPKGQISLHLDVKACIFSVGEPTHVYFSLFSVQQQRFISEEYVVELTAAGMPENIDLLGKLQAEFREIESSMFKEGLYLVCHIYRIGQLKVSPKINQRRHKIPQTYRRPFGCAVINLCSFRNMFESFGNWTSPPHLTIYRAKDPLQFIELHNLIIRGGSSIEVVPQAKGLALGLMLAEMSTIMNPSTGVQMLQLSSFINPAEDRNDFYVTLRGGDFLQDKKKSSKNIEIRIRVFTAAGFVVPDCIYRGAGPTVTALTEYCSTVYYHWNSPVYCESIKLRISKQIFSQCHLLFTVWHVSSSPEKNQLCSFTFLPLTCSSGAVIADGLHVLPCYKPLKNLGQQNATLRYLDANAHFRDSSSSQSVLSKRKEELFVETLLSSVKTTQLDSLHALFNWRQLDAFHLKSTVAKFTTISGTELSKFVKEVFETLFSIMQTFPNHHEELSNLVYVGLLHCIDQLTTKMCSVSGAIDTYISDVFTFTDVYAPLISHSRIALVYATQHTNSPNPSMFKQLTLLSKCFQYVIRFIVRSAHCSNVVDLNSFREQFRGILDDMFLLLAIRGGPKDLLIGCKAFLLRSLSSTFTELSLVFSSEDLGRICLSLLTAVPPHQDNSKLFVYNLRMIGNIAQSVLEYQESCWRLIQASVISSLHFHLNNSAEETYLSVHILSNLIATMQSAPTFSPTNLSPFYPLLPSLAHALAKSTTQQIIPSPQIALMCNIDIALDTYSSFYIILHSMDANAFAHWIEQNMSLCHEILNICSAALKHSVYPSTWIVLRSWELSIFAKLLTTIAMYSSSLDQLIIQDFLLCCVYFDQHKDFKTLKQSHISYKELSSLPGTVRAAARNVWKKIGKRSDYAQYFFYNLLSAVFNDHEGEITNDLTPLEDLAIEMFHDLLEEEYSSTGEFLEINRLTVDTLDTLAHESQQDAFVFVKKLGKVLMSRLGSGSEALKTSVERFLSQLEHLYDLMRSVLKIPRTNAFEHERAGVVIQLLNYLLSDCSIGRRKNMLYRYYSYLTDLNSSIGAFAEAGNSILWQLKLLEWSNEMTSFWQSVEASNTDSETDAQRKESLYLKAIDFFDRAEQWETAITACEDLKVYYQTVTRDYNSLATILEKEAAFFRKIATESRFYPSYFRVVFFNERSSRSEYVYRGLKLESIMDFTERIRAKHTDARIIMSSDDPSNEILGKGEVVITITAVTLSNLQESMEVLRPTEEGIPKEILNGESHRNASWFMFCKAENRSTEDQPENEFKDLWVKKTFIRTEEPFPNVRRRLLVVESVQRLIHPIDTARETIQRKNVELKAAIVDLQRNRNVPPDLGPLTMQLSGIIDAAVNGGTSKYIEAFLSFPIEGKQESQCKLKQLMTSQIDLLQSGLDVFKERKNADLNPLYNRLRNLFEKMAVSLSENNM